MKIVQFSNPGSIAAYPAEGSKAFGKTVPIGDFIVGEYYGDADLEPYTGPWPYVSPDEKSREARNWRNLELTLTDWIVPVTDHPKHAAYMAYRQALRDWPSTNAFPDTRPELGA